MKLSFKLLILSGRETVIFCLLEKVTSEGIVLLPCNTLTSSVPKLAVLFHTFPLKSINSQHFKSF